MWSTRDSFPHGRARACRTGGATRRKEERAFPLYSITSRLITVVAGISLAKRHAWLRQSDCIKLLMLRLCSRDDCTGKLTPSFSWSLCSGPRNNLFHPWSCSYSLRACTSLFVPCCCLLCREHAATRQPSRSQPMESYLVSRMLDLLETKNCAENFSPT